ncbi:Ig-like domain-containing protein [Microbacterium sp. A196]|uniref:Ig-like domain-containing protein n=1 Tax=unclassified Microbacterium TaxID=2609290 RepID=UPI003FD53DA8
MRRSFLSASAVVALAAGALFISTPAYADPISYQFKYTVTNEGPSTVAWPSGGDCSTEAAWDGGGRRAITSVAVVSATGLYTFRDLKSPVDGRFIIFEGAFDRNDVSNCVAEVDDFGLVNLEADVEYTMVLAAFGGQSGTVSYHASGPGIFGTATTLLGATTVLTASSGTVAAGDPVDLTATVARPGFTANFEGNVEFFDGATSLGEVPVSATGQAALPNVALTSGSHQITAHYAGNTWVLPSISAPVTVEVEPPVAATTTVVTAANASVEAGTEVSFNAEVTGATPTGTVEFFADGISLGSATTTASASATTASATLTTASLAVGTHSITAAYGGDFNNAASTSLAALTLTVTAVPDPEPAPTPDPAPAPVPVTPVVKPDPAKNDTSAKQLAATGAELPLGLLSGGLTIAAGATLLFARQRARRTRQA